MNSGMLEIHQEAREASIVVYNDFLRSYKANMQVVYGFVEGKDDLSFYQGPIEQLLPSNWRLELIEARSRAQVLDLLDYVDWSLYARKRICYFVDRDLSDFQVGEAPSAENLYITDGYSIENDVVDFGTMARVLREVFNITRMTEAELLRIRELYESNLAVFQQAMTPVMAQILLWKRDGETPNLDNVQPKAFFEITEGRLTLKQEFASSASRITDAAERAKARPSTLDQISLAEAEFRSKQGPTRLIRGKYVLWLFTECAQQFHRCVAVFCAKHRNPPKLRVSIGAENAMVFVGPRARCPVTLRQFIERNYVEYVEAANRDAVGAPQTKQHQPSPA